MEKMRSSSTDVGTWIIPRSAAAAHSSIPSLPAMVLSAINKRQNRGWACFALAGAILSIVPTPARRAAALSMGFNGMVPVAAGSASPAAPGCTPASSSSPPSDPDPLSSPASAAASAAALGEIACLHRAGRAHALAQR
eukprot:CAMPEP_0202862148 /NCGR_PEP_ID=MMETSP1391-20130828/3296_1 /ASSEMBLY_ACC=CAM_ASM_000867 /TAXON_ID=1034604 /ORGANISM="Chlamydomonas leiostraca, Strain SAG 11-49" /LENGTH=137 /DNA_ID=CAMNT_0049541643 /DNA_START=179 /DNA_END=590 /DNA_ORIENTATION=+